MGKCNELTKYMLMEEIMLPESNRTPCDVLSIRATVEHTIPLEEVAAWMYGSWFSVSFPLGCFLGPQRVTWNQPIVLERSDDI